MRDAVCCGFGLAIGLWCALNIWFIRYAWGYKAGVKMCLEAIEPLRVELRVHRVKMEQALAPTSVLREHVSEETKKETRH